MSLDAQAATQAAAAVPGIPRDEEGPVFREPWEAQAFAMAVVLHSRGLFTWVEWAAALAAEIKRAQAAGDADVGDTYYRHWLATLEHLVAEKGVATASTLHRYRDAWDHAADRTPHGQPIELAPHDFASAESLEIPAGSIALVVNGGLMRGMRSQHRMEAAQARLVRVVTTAPVYRLWSIADGFPGMVRSATGGASITAELYIIPYAGFVAILEGEPDGLCVGRVLLSDGTTSLGVMAEPRLVEGHTEITSYGGWGAYVEAKSISQIPKAAASS